MLEASSPGRALPKSKSIDVEANLLSQWLVDRSRLAEKIARRAAYLATAIGIGCAAIPLLYATSARVERDAKKYATAEAALDLQLKQAQAASSDAQPKLEEDRMLHESQEKVLATLGQLVQVLNAAPAGVEISSAKVEAMGGELTLLFRAEAVDSSTGRTFVDRASQGPDVISALQASTTHSDSMSKDGVSFQFVKRVKVGD